jgi:hypothetical protein
MAWNSLVFAVGSALLALAGGTFMAYVTVRTNVPFRPLIVATAMVPLIIPGLLYTISWIMTEPSSGNGANEWAGQVLTRSFLGESVDHIVRVGEHELRARCGPNVSIRAETAVTVRIDPANLTLIPMDT